MIDERDLDGRGAGISPSIATALMRGALFPAAIWSGAETRFTWMNEAFRGLLQTGRMDVLGLPVAGFLSDELPATLLLDAAYTGSPHVVPDYERVQDEDRDYWHLVFLPTLQGFGPYDVLVIAREVEPVGATRRSRERARELMMGSLSLIGTTILSTLDPAEILQRTVVEAVEAFDADWGWIAERAEGGWAIRNTHGITGAPEGRTFAEDEGSLPRLAATAGRVVKGSRGDRPTLEMSALLNRHQLDGFLLVPVFDHGVVEAVLGFCWGSPVAITDEHTRIAEQLSVSVSLALTNARTLNAERELGRRLTSAFFAAPDQVPGLEIGSVYRSASFGARVGGDFFDVVRMANGRAGIVIGDVAGHGVDAAPLAGAVKGLLRSELALQAAPSQLARRANELVLRDAGGYASAFLGVWEPEHARLRYCTAGHPAPVLLTPGGSPSILPQRQVVLGVDETSVYRESRAAISEGDLLVLYTDGLTEARNADGVPFGQERLLDAIGRYGEFSARDVPEALFMEAFSHSGGEMRDDVAILAVRVLVAA